jgi:hypothetical protein
MSYKITILHVKMQKSLNFYSIKSLILGVFDNFKDLNAS